MTDNISDIEQVIFEAYGSLETPDFSFVQKAVDGYAYGELVTSLKSNFAACDHTDINYDVCFSFIVGSEKCKLFLQLSMVGKYAGFYRLSDAGRVVKFLSDSANELREKETNIVKLLLENNFRILTRKDMEIQVHLVLINTEPENVCVYQALFSDTDFFPWQIE